MTSRDACDVAIIGGAVMGSATAWFLTNELGFQGRVIVIERDPSYMNAASSRSTSGFRQQFSTRVNIEIARSSAEFLLNADEILADGDDNAGIGVKENGYLYLGGPGHAEGFERNHALQRSLGVDAVLLTPGELSLRFPWLRVNDVAVGSFGESGEGWFDGYLLMSAFRRQARKQGTEYRAAEALSLHQDGSGFRIGLDDGDDIEARTLVLTAGVSTPALAAQLGIELPVTPAKQTVFSFSSPFRVEKMPYIFTPDGLFCRPEGKDFIAGIGISDGEAAALDDFEANYALFDESVWPRLARRVEAFENVRFRSGWAGHYDMSRFDHNPFVGPIEEVPGLYVACGFSGHGIMQSPAIGRALAELIACGAYRTLDLTPLAFARIALEQPIFEGIQY